MHAFIRRTAALVAVAMLVVSVPFAATAAPQTAAIAPMAIPIVDLKAVTFPSSSVGYAAGALGTIVKTTDGGSSWAAVRSGDSLDFTGLAFWSTTSGIAVTSGRQVWGTIDGGASWTLRNPDVTAYASGTPQIRVNGVAAVPGTSSWASLVGGDPNGGDPLNSDQIFNGETVGHTEQPPAPEGTYWYPWYEVKPYFIDPTSPEMGSVGEGEFFGIDFVSSTHGWAVGADYYSAITTSSIAATVDGGYTWTRRYLGAAVTLKAVSFASTGVGVTTSSDGRVFHTSDGGTTWAEGSSGTVVSLNGVAMIDTATGYAVGNGGTVIKTTNGGATWAPEVSGTTNDLLAVTAIGTVVVAVGRAGTVIRLGADTTGPTMTSLTSSTHASSSTWYSHNDPAFAWSATDPSGIAGYSYVLDQSPGTNPTTATSNPATTTSFTDKADGTWYMHVRAVDTLGNWGTALHLQVNIDTVAPSMTSLTSSTHVNATTWYSNNDPAFSWSASDTHSGVSGYSYVLDQSAETTPGTTSAGSATTISYPDKADGVWYFHVRARDAAGNWGTVSHREVRIDTTGPLMGAVSSPTHPAAADWYANNDPQLGWGATDALSTVAGYSYTLDQSPGTDPTTATSNPATTASFTNTADGTWYFHVRALDAVGNWGAATHRTVKIDTAPPTTTDDHDAVYAGPATITLTPTDTHSGVARTDYSLGGVSGTGTTVNASAEGDYTLDYASVDNAGNRETTVTVYFRIDLSVLTIASLESSTHPSSLSWYANNDPAFSWTASDPGSVAGYSFELDQSVSTIPDETSEGTGARASFADKADGTWYFHVRALDTLGRWGSTDHLAVRIDTAAPTVTTLSSSTHASSTTWYSNNDPGFTWTATDALSTVVGYSYELDQIAATTPDTTSEGAGTSYMASNKSDGTWYFHVRALDAAGNWSAPSHRTVLIDTAPPLTTAGSSVVPGSGAVTLNAFDSPSGVAGIAWSVVGGASGTGPSTTTITLTGAGTYTVNFRATDIAGNQEVQRSIQVVVPPVVPDELIVTPIAGNNRIDTAILASQEAFPAGATTVVIATGFNWPDALGGAALAGALDGPILLTDPS
ncbi:MAG: OmpL47-type beta-barrel domain-containing protein, partial [Coriobacteriia bacterium]